MKKIIIFIVLLLILAGAGYFYYDYKNQKQTEAIQSTPQSSESQEQKKDEQDIVQKENIKDYPELGIGDEGEYVIKLHQKLNDLKIFPANLVDVDHYGEKTQHSVMLFQLTQNLEPNGVVNQETWEALNNPQPISQDSLVKLKDKIPIDEGHISEDFVKDKIKKTDTKIDVNENTDTSKHHPDEEKTDNDKKVAYFTFDDGPNRNYSPQILEILDKYNARATFFVIGNEAEKMPDILKEENKYGCVLGNHTYSHINLENASTNEVKNEIEKTNNIIKETLGKTPKCLRPPYGSISKNEKSEILKDFGMETILWDVDPQDWSRPGTQNIIDHVLKYIQPGEITLMHDGGGDRSQTVTALKTIMKTLSEEGWTFKSICDYQ